MPKEVSILISMLVRMAPLLPVVNPWETSCSMVVPMKPASVWPMFDTNIAAWTGAASPARSSSASAAAGTAAMQRWREGTPPRRDGAARAESGEQSRRDGALSRGMERPGGHDEAVRSRLLTSLSRAPARVKLFFSCSGGNGTCVAFNAVVCKITLRRPPDRLLFLVI